MPRVLPLVALLLVMAILSSCELPDLLRGELPGEGSHPGSGGLSSQVTKEVDSLRLVLQTPKSSYRLGEPIPLKFEVINTGATPVELTFPTGQRFDLLIRREGELIWRWSFGKQFIQVVSQVRLEPDQVLSFEVEWPQVDNLGNAVPPGRYEAIALLMITTPLESTELSIWIE